MDFTRIKQLVVPEGVVKKIEIGGQSIWQSEPEEMNGPFTAAQSAAIRAGDFTDVPVGYAWTFEDVPYTYVDANNATQSDKYSGTMRVADCDYYLGTGDVECTTHHVVVVPDANMYSAQMNKTSTTSRGYVGSEMYKTHLRRAQAIFEACFGVNHILTHREYLVNFTQTGEILKTSSREISGGWYNSTVELMDERMVLGKKYGSNGSLPSVSRTKLSLFKNNSDRIASGSTYWLRNVSNFSNSSNEEKCFMSIYSDGSVKENYIATNSLGVRPYALIY